MALYKVILDGKIHVNPTLFRAANNFGPAGAARAVAGGVRQVAVLDDILYAVEVSQEKKYRPLADSTVEQNVDATLKTFVALTNDDIFNLKTYEGQKRPVVTAISKPEQVLEFKGWKLVRMHDIPYSSKYHFRNRMAVLQICGSFYVALNARLRKETAPVVIVIKA